MMMVTYIIVLMSVATLAVVATMYVNGGSDGMSDGSGVNDGGVDDGSSVNQWSCVRVGSQGGRGVLVVVVRVVVHQVMLGRHRVAAVPEVTRLRSGHQRTKG